MKTDFKYPILSLFFDIDGVACMFLDELREAYPGIDKITLPSYAGIEGERELESFAWDIEKTDGTRVEIVLTVEDAQLFIDPYLENLESPSTK